MKGQNDCIVSLNALCYAIIDSTTWNEHIGMAPTYNQKHFRLEYTKYLHRKRNFTSILPAEIEVRRREEPDEEIHIKKTNLFNEKGNELNFNDEIFPFKITKLIVENSSGYNDDPRCRINEREELYPEYKVLRDRESHSERFPLPWLVNYEPRCEIENIEGITYKDLAKGIFSVKSGKRDTWYELFMFAELNLDTKNKKLYINLEFDHGS